MAYSNEEREAIFERIFDLIEDGKSLRKALLLIPLSSKTFYEWIEEDEDKVKRYARAAELRADALVDEMIDIADDSDSDILQYDIGDGIIATKVNNEVIQRSRLRYDARKWLASKLNPKKYGNKVQTEHSGEIKTTIISLGNGINPNEATD